MTSSVINLVVLVALAARRWSWRSSPGRSWTSGRRAATPTFRDLVASLTRILLITPAIFAVSTFCASVLNSYHRFAVAAHGAAHVQPGDHRRRATS